MVKRKRSPAPFCPPLSLKGFPQGESCTGERCRLWDKAGKRCSIISTARKLRRDGVDVLRDT